MVAWLDANYLSEPVIHQIIPHPGTTRLITCFTAATPELAAGPGFVAAAGASDGSWFLVQGSTQGIYTKHLATESAAHPEPRGMLGALGSALSWGYNEAFNPSAKYIKRTASCRRAVGIACIPVDASRVKFLVLSDTTVDCWLVGGLVGACIGVHGCQQWDVHGSHAHGRAHGVS